MTGGESKATYQPAVRQSGVCSGRRWPSDEELIGRALSLSGLSEARQDDIEFYAAAAREGALNGRDARKRGEALSKQEKADLGIAYRGIISAEFVATLNDAVIADPEGAAWKICSHASRLIQSRDHIRTAVEQEITLLRFRASTMATGPCKNAQALDESRVATAEAEIAPFDQCLHPDQCGCMWQAWSPLMDQSESDA